MDARTLASVRRDQRVAYIESDGIVTTVEEVEEVPTDALDAAAAGPAATWGLDRIDQRDRPLNGRYVTEADGRGVSVYVVDTGIRRTHIDFGARVVGGRDFVGDRSNRNNFSDCNGHGTHVAGTVAGTQWGVSKNASLYGVRVLNCSGSGSYSSIIAGMDWVSQTRSGPAVMNMSLGGSRSQALNDAVANTTAAGVLVVVAAGNETTDACRRSPASAPSAITVASTTTDDSRSWFSNFGSCVDLFAPGSSIKSAYNTSDTATATLSGTSMASPHAAGVAAQFLQVNRQATPGGVTDAILSRASVDKVSGVIGSPNKLIFSRVTPRLCLGRLPTITGSGEIRGTSGNDVILGSGGNDTIYGGGGVDFICSGAGNDVVYGGDGNDRIDAGIGDDVVRAGRGDDRVFAGSGNDRVTGQDGRDIIDGQAGDDVLMGSAGPDTIYGGPGADRVLGENDNDRLFGSAGDDFLDGGRGNDICNGNNGRDRARDCETSRQIP